MYDETMQSIDERTEAHYILVRTRTYPDVIEVTLSNFNLLYLIDFFRIQTSLTSRNVFHAFLRSRP